jgi:RsiW-degrading membrane proteinase PrsW (M82 family)
VILAIAVLAFQDRAQIWHLYVMAAMVAAGFWMFWPTITALIQELTPKTNTLLPIRCCLQACRADG